MKSWMFSIFLFFACLTLLTQYSAPLALPAIDPYPDECPKGRIDPSPENCCGLACTFNGSISGWDPAIEPVVEWKVSGGKVVSGQGTLSVKVEACERWDKPVTLTLKVTGKGLPEPCIIEETYEVKSCPGMEGNDSHAAPNNGMHPTANSVASIR